MPGHPQAGATLVGEERPAGRSTVHTAQPAGRRRAVNPSAPLHPGARQTGRVRRWIGGALTALVAVAGLGLGGAGWHYSDEILTPLPAAGTARAAAAPVPMAEVNVPGELGPMPALLAEAGSPTWVLLVHGRGATRGDALDLVPVLADLGYAAMAVSYRNDPDAPAAPDGRYGLGATEWRDLDAAVTWARDAGARDVVLVGYSMGGAVVTSWLHSSPQAAVARGVVLDAPVLTWRSALDAGADARGVPRWLTPVAETAVELRTDIDFAALDQLARADELRTPVLLVHGSADDVVPVEASRRLAAVRPDLVTYLEVPGAGHVGSQTTAPDRYRSTVEAFLSSVATPAPPAASPASAGT